MKKIISLFVTYPFYANVSIAIIIIAGLVSLFNLKLSFFPETKSHNIFVTVAYPGASPKEMEEGVTMRVEQALRSIIGIKEITSTSSENICNINIRVMNEYDVDDVLIEVKNAVDGITSFPVSAEKPIVFKQRPVTFASFLALSGDVDLLTLKMLADDIENDFLTSGILSQVTITGVPALEISVEASEETLLRYGLTFDDISRAISLNNIDISGGIIRSGEREMLIRARNRSTSPDQISNMVLRANPDGSLIYIRDVASVKLQFAEGPGKSYMNGKPSISFRVNKLPEEDLRLISSYVTNYVEEFNAKHPRVKFEITYDFIENLHARLNMLLKNGGMGLILVVLMLGLFLNFRLSAWVAWGIPSAFLSMFVLGNMYGLTINMVSLFGMILVIGILVDDGIVIGENIFSHFERGKSPKRAAIDGTMEVVPAVVTSVLTTVVAFTPLFFVEGRMEMMTDVAFVVIVSLIFSMFEAFFVLPAHLSSTWVLREVRRQGKAAKYRQLIDRSINLFRNRIYGKFLRWAINYRAVVLTIPVGLILITVGLFGGNFIKMTFFPSIPFDQFNVDISFKPGTGEQVTIDHLKKFEKVIWEVNDELKKEFKDTLDYVEYSFRSTGSAFNGLERGSHAGNIFVLLRDLEDTQTSSYDIVNRIQEKIGPVPEAEKFIVAGRNTFGDPVSVTLLGKNTEELNQAKEFIKSKLRTIDALTNISDNNVLGMREIRLKLKPQAYILGFTTATLSNQIRQGFFGGQAQRLQSGPNELRVWVRYPKTDRTSIGQFEKIKVKTPKGEYPMTELVDYEILRGPVSIRHYNGSREITVTAGVYDPNEALVPITDKIDGEFIPEMLAQYPGIKVTYLGQQKESKESGESLGKYYTIAFAIMLLLIMLNFRSFSQMFIILAMIPLGIIGALWGHGIEGIPVSMLSVWGIVALTGVIVNDAIVFLQKYNSLLLEGFKLKDAVFEAGMARFRAILLTTITTTVGLYPIILEKSFQAQFLRPLAVALAYGVFFGTIFILIFFPAMIVFLNDTKRGWKWLFTGNKPEPEEVEIAIINSKKEIKE